MNAPDRASREESVRQYCRVLRLPTMGVQFVRLAEHTMLPTAGF